MPLDNPRTTQLVTAKDHLEYLAAYFSERNGRTYRSMRLVEFQTPEKLRSTPVAGTIFEPIAGALAEANIAVGGNQTSVTIGDVMDVLALDQDKTNRMVCHCANGDVITNTQLASNLAAAAKSA